MLLPLPLPLPLPLSLAPAPAPAIFLESSPPCRRSRRVFTNDGPYRPIIFVSLFILLSNTKFKEYFYSCIELYLADSALDRFRDKVHPETGAFSQVTKAI